MNQPRTKLLWQLFSTFFTIGLFTFGGGYAMLPLIMREVVHHHQWMKEDEILEMTAIAESTPGPIAINSATFVGQRMAGFSGALAATTGVVLPSFTIILLLSQVLDTFSHLPAVAYAFIGVRAGVLALIFHTLWKMAKKVERSTFPMLIAALAFLGAGILGLNAILVLLCCAIFGYIVFLTKDKEAKA